MRVRVPPLVQNLKQIIVMMLVDSLLVLLSVGIVGATCYVIVSNTKAAKDTLEESQTESPVYRGVDDRPNKLFDKL